MKGLDFVIKKTSSDLNLPEDQVKKLLISYWKEIEQQITKIESTTVSIKDIGVITVSKLKIRNFIFDTIDRIKRMRKSNKYSEINKNKYLGIHFSKLKNALKHRNILAKDYAEKYGNI